jgi:(4S)-4-hydroxy-5-phosphonooxypentane-2,3-dione isomerase
VRDERGCRQFDVFVPKGEKDRVMLYEIYDNEAAFREHLQTVHYAVFDRDSRALVESSAVIRADLAYSGAD